QQTPSAGHARVRAGPPTPAGHPRRHQAMPGTHPNGAAPPGVGARAGVNHGNTKLWTAMWPGGVIKADPDYVDKDGSIHMKFGVVARGQRTVVDPGASGGGGR